ncbi:polysaccharide lyase family 8 super-sandwich domain-containing protein [Clostridium sp.]|uniref:polysaccharide lyase family 8 super-sandwich domain-containing protein n=1 Tax=Clostridium sp. TaxID=1506 RepID=UPI003F3D0265
MIKRKESTKKLIASAIAGTVVITSTFGTVASAYTVSGENTESSITLTAENEAEIIESIRLKWKEDLVGGVDLDVNNESISKKIKGYVNQTNTYLGKLNLDPANDWLFDDLKNYKENSASITSMYKYVVSMAMAYNLPNEKYYQNEELKNNIVYALDWLNENAYNGESEQYGNWWDWMIGIPAQLNNAVILMYDALNQEQIENYMAGIQKFIPSIEPDTNKNHTGANLADVCMNKLLQGVNLKNAEYIKEGAEDIRDVLQYVTKGDGFYPDGSYVQHGIVAYTGSYGNVLIEKVSNILFLTEGTPWAMPAEDKETIYKWIFESFDPIIYKGYVMDMVRGRSISRHNSNGYMQASGIIGGMIKIGMISDEAMANKINALVKQWAKEASSVLDFGTRFGSINVISEFYDIMADDAIVPAKQGAEHHALNMMDKTIHERADYGLGIARSSTRISKYEFMNKENLTPWFQGDGMTYLHNEDLTQFSDDFWSTIDPYRMPGTTVDTREREKKVILPDIEPSSPLQDEVYYELGNSSWSGGTKLGNYGVSGMQIDNKYDSLTANKSWFMFDDEIVALGSDITNPEDHKVETIVENRKIRKDGSNIFTVDGVEKVQALGDSDKVAGAKWAHLEGSVEGSDIGYYFPEGADINILRDDREGNWYNINEGKPEADKIVTNNYLTMYMDHGSVIENEKYSYVLLPNKSSEEVKAYSENSRIEIIKNDDIAHGVKHLDLKIEGANFWVDGENTSGSITSSGKSSVMTKENEDGTLTIAVSDPTFEGESLSISIDKSALEIVEVDDNISNVNLNDGKIAFDVNTKEARGASFELTVKLGEKDVTPEEKNEAPVINGEDIKLFVGDKWSKEAHKVSALDKEDGDLTDKVELKSHDIDMDKNSVVTKDGEYTVIFKVADSNGLVTEKELKVTVEKRETKPTNPNKPDNKPGKLPNTGAVVGGSAIAVIGGLITAAGASMFRRKKK